MPRNPHQPDLTPFLVYVEKELEYLEAFDLSSDYDHLKVAAALVILQEYLNALCDE